jgi:pinin
MDDFLSGKNYRNYLYFSDRKRNSNSFESYRRSDNKYHDSPPVKQQRKGEVKTKSVFSRLSSQSSNRGDEDYELPKQKLQSRIVKEMPSREDIVQMQSGDELSRARNKRMFGSLLGTLQKFCQEESRLKPKEEKKAQIEKKLEQQEQLEKEKMRMEKQNLFEDRKRKQLEIKALEIKMYKLRDLAAWEESKKPLVNFIRTKSKPHIYFIPKILNSKTQEKLDASKGEVDSKFQ